MLNLVYIVKGMGGNRRIFYFGGGKSIMALKYVKVCQILYTVNNSQLLNVNPVSIQLMKIIFKIIKA